MRAARGSEEADVHLLAGPSGELFWAGGSTVQLDFGDQLFGTHGSTQTRVLRLINCSDQTVQLSVRLVSTTSQECEQQQLQGHVEQPPEGLFRAEKDDVYLAAKRTVELVIALDSSTVRTAGGRLSAEFQLHSPLVTRSLALTSTCQLQHLSVALEPSTTLDFGAVLTRSTQSQKVLVTNKTGVELQLRASMVHPTAAAGGSAPVPSSAGTRPTALATVRPQGGFCLGPYSTEAMDVQVDAGEQGGQDLGCWSLRVLANTPTCAYQLPLAGSVVQPCFRLEALQAAGDPLVVAAGSVLRGPALQPGQEGKLVLVLHNTGSVPFGFTLRPSGSQLRVRPTADASSVPVNGRAEIQLELQASAAQSGALSDALAGSRPRPQAAVCELLATGLGPMSFTVEWLVAPAQLRLAPAKHLAFALDTANRQQFDECYESGVFVGISTELRASNTGQVPVELKALESRGDEVQCVSPSLPLVLEGGRDVALTLRLQPPAVLRAVRSSYEGHRSASGSCVLQTSIVSCPESVLSYSVAVPMPHVTPVPTALDFGSIPPEQTKPLILQLRNEGTAGDELFVLAEQPSLTATAGLHAAGGGVRLVLISGKGKADLSDPCRAEMATLPVPAQCRTALEVRVEAAADATPGRYVAGVTVRRVPCSYCTVGCPVLTSHCP